MSYDPSINKWLFSNAGLIKEINDINILAKKVKKAFTKNGYATFITEISGNKSDQAKLVNCIQAWKLDQKFIDLHVVDKEKATRVDSNDNSWLFSAVRLDDEDTVDLLIKQVADVNALSKKHNNVLHMAVREGRINNVKLLLENGVDVAEVDGRGLAPFLLAARGGDVPIAKLLLDYGADPTKPDKVGSTPLYHAAEKGHVKMIELIMATGVTHDANEDDETPLFIAVKNNHIDAVKVMLNYFQIAENWDDPNVDDETPLGVAVKNGNWEMIEILLQKARELKQLKEEHLVDAINLAKTPNLAKNNEKITSLLFRYKNNIFPKQRKKTNIKTNIFNKTEKIADGGIKRKKPEQDEVLGGEIVEENEGPPTKKHKGSGSL